MVKVLCNLCGKSIDPKDHEESAYLQHFDIVARSTKEQISFDLCAGCAEKVIDGLVPKFAYPPDVVEADVLPSYEDEEELGMDDNEFYR